ncbi:MAG: hypothetical protein WCG67_04605, partial [Ferruginibacter sp.]
MANLITEKQKKALKLDYRIRLCAVILFMICLLGFFILAYVVPYYVSLDKKDLKVFLVIWFAISMLAAMKGIMQIQIGPDKWENAWLDAGGAITHRIQGKLRAFSFYSDAGQFGAAMGHTALVAGIMAIGPGPRKRKILLTVIAFDTLMGMLFSGTR